jgi:hypothetical protein
MAWVLYSCELFVYTRLMKYLTKKDWMLIVLFFIFVTTIVSLAVLVMHLDETPLENSLPATISMLAGVGILLFLPVHYVVGAYLQLTNQFLIITTPGYLGVIPVITAIFYSVIFGSVLSRWNRRKN